jgi:transposase
MPVYPVAAGFATSCASPGCWCRDRRPCYPSDLTDDQWAVLEPRAREVMSELTVAVGRPMVHDLRAMCDAVSYAVKSGVEWRALPADFPPWESAYAFFERWNGRGLPAELVRRLRELLRQHQGRAAQPTACIVDSQVVKAHDTVRKATSGYHGGKKITGRGRHLAVDTEGWLLALVVTAASASDKAGAKILLIKLFDAFSTLTIMWADTGYYGKPLARYAQAVAAITVEVVARASPHSFQVLRRRWVVERTFGWLMRYRRLARDYERTTASSEAMIYWVTVIIMTRRLARYENGQPRPSARVAHDPAHPSKQLYLQALVRASRDLANDFGTCQPTSQGRRDLDHLRQRVRRQDDDSPPARAAAPARRARRWRRDATTDRVWLPVADSR